ncbi:30S ribosome-binding factor RbfA [Paroceanicella profunda]|uniref:Ribosome-binding factor A n=1 Tax=Paroceanicella profunda TaxID=2579971 RepID=A0A5B8FYP3_9RHOB|nr:30S ribosome-binding factor RbfA [Paroceanicella profunda]QDL91789.1 30S ribosome-binding factor RbfA [Paroceanicella profunda]
MAKRQFTETSGPSQRMLRVGELIRHALSDVLSRGDLHDPDLGRSPITVSEVRCSPDLRHATVFVLPLLGENTDGVIAALERNRGELRRVVTRAVKLKFSPELHFQPDDSFDRMDETRRLLASDTVRRDVEQDEDETDEDETDGDEGGEDTGRRDA